MAIAAGVAPGAAGVGDPEGLGVDGEGSGVPSAPIAVGAGAAGVAGVGAKEEVGGAEVACGAGAVCAGDWLTGGAAGAVVTAGA